MRDLEERHISQLDKHRDEMEKKLSTKFKPSPELLNLRRIQLNLAKQKEYAEAHKVQVRVQ